MGKQVSFWMTKAAAIKAEIDRTLAARGGGQSNSPGG